MDFAGRLKLAMSERDVKAAELAKITGISEGAISQYLKGKYQAGQRSLDKLAEALNVPIGWLMGAGQDTPIPHGTFEGGKEEEKHLDSEIAMRLSMLTPEEWEKVDAFVQGLLASR